MHKAVRILCVLLSVTLLGGCRLLTFTAEPGSPRKEYPAEMQGRYMAIEKQKKGNDTTFVTITATGAETNDAFLGKILQLTDTTTLSHLGDFYFFNIRNTENGTIQWWTFPVRVKKDALYIFSLSQGKQEKKIGKYLKLKGNIRGEYIMDNEPFKKYCEKHLKKRKAFKFKRIK